MAIVTQGKLDPAAVEHSASPISPPSIVLYLADRTTQVVVHLRILYRTAVEWAPSLLALIVANLFP